MAYDDYELSDSRNSRAELFLFRTEDGLHEWGFTTGAAINVGGVDYLPEVITHEAFSASANEGSQDEITLEMPWNNPVVAIHLPYLPPKPISVLVRSYQRRDMTMELRTEFDGFIRAAQQKGVFGYLRCSQNNDPTNRLVPRATHGGGCRHFTYGEACTLDREDWKTVVADLTDVDGYDLEAPSILAAGTGWFKWGYAENPANGEVRYITEHVGNKVTLQHPFTDITTATTLHLFAGDDQTAATCKDKFNNKVNYLGFDFFPNFNVFASGALNGAGNCGTGNGDSVPAGIEVPSLFAHWPLTSGPEDIIGGRNGTFVGTAGPGMILADRDAGMIVEMPDGSLNLNRYGTMSMQITVIVSNEDSEEPEQYDRVLVANFGSRPSRLANYYISLYGNYGAELRYPRAGYTQPNWDDCSIQQNAQHPFGAEITYLWTKGASGTKLYKNGLLIASSASACATAIGSPALGAVAWPGTHFQVGGCGATGASGWTIGWTGRARDVKLWTTELNADQAFIEALRMGVV